MTRPDPRFQLLDPVDPEAAEPDPERLLESILTVEPVPATRHRRRRPRLLIGVGIASMAVLVALAVGIARGPGGNAVAAAYEAVHQPGTILHYTRRTTMPGGAPGARRQFFDEEVWQAGDGSRQRIVSHLPQVGLHEEVVDGDRSLTYNESTDELVVYDEKAPEPAAPGAVHADAMGDPRTLLERARRGDTSVEELGETRVRGIDVVQFRIGTCHVKSTVMSGGRSTEIRPALVVSIAEDDDLPVRVAPTCPAEDRPRTSRREHLPMQDVRTDYLGFEVLPATKANERRLEMTPHPGARVIDGEDVDAAEERADRNFDTSPPIANRGPDRIVERGHSISP